MQTFLPFANMERSVSILDRQRLGKQRVETFQIVQRIVGARLVSTKKIETDSVRDAYYDDQDRLIREVPHDADPDEYEELDGWDHMAVTPVWKTVDLPKSEWTVEPLDPGGWDRHPAFRMWRNHLGGLVEYQWHTCREWVSRGYVDTCWEKTLYLAPMTNTVLPPWFGSMMFHRSHRSNLLRKMPEHYRPFFSDRLSDHHEYVWPE